MSKQPVVVSAISAPAALTPYEWRTLREVATGDKYSVIAERLGCAEQTVKNHMWNVHHKLNVSSTIDIFVRVGWLKVPE